MNPTNTTKLLRPALILLPLLGSRLAAQSLPAYRSVNPNIASRSALGFQPVVPDGDGWHGSLRVDYANVLESQNRPTGAAILLDGELMRTELLVSRGFGRWFVQGALPIESAQPGSLDGFLNWWHGVFGFNESVRKARPENLFEYKLQLPGRDSLMRERGGTAFGDARVTVGFHHAPGWQTSVIVALPTNGRPEGWGLDAVALGATTAVRVELWKNRLNYEGSLGLGYTPSTGSLAKWQNTFFVNATSGLRLRVLGLQSVYGNLLFHSATWHDTTLPALDNQDVSLDFGFLFKVGGGPEILAGMIEDMYPFGPAVDMVLRLGVRW